MHDITETAIGSTPPATDHVMELLEFVRRWDQSTPLLIHCYAGLSRSSAAAYISLCALNPEAPEEFIARALRRSSDTAMPNRLFVEHRRPRTAPQWTHAGCARGHGAQPDRGRRHALRHRGSACRPADAGPSRLTGERAQLGLPFPTKVAPLTLNRSLIACDLSLRGEVKGALAATAWSPLPDGKRPVRNAEGMSAG